jgi:hypothetical protein
MGRFTLRLPQTLHLELERRANAEGVSLNQYIIYALTRQVTPAYSVEIATQEDVQNQRRRFEELLAGLRDAAKSPANERKQSDEFIELEDGLSTEDVARLRERISAVQSANQN